ncbi:MAG: SRPBCC domain-containing protein [Neisseria sp.]|uniref:SRPBCC domain-containing protein n=1 Tax=Neisseria sp. TaxID=192066 RepID=UPI0026DC666B|nr:SRPBCC domain-containing protein [Neisseria sp.]MDO4641721.1 SRPBCC domain-containing protein [Neisseria sp.]
MSNQQPAIIWPEQYTPGETDNFASNEVIVKGLSVADVWPYLNDTKAWPVYYENASNIVVGDSSDSRLFAGAQFVFDTFGFHVESEVLEYRPAEGGNPARLAWRGVFGEGDDFCDVYHAWLLQDLPGNRVRILTQESQIGKPAQALAKATPNPMINGHQAWLNGLVHSAQNRTPF